MRFYDISIWGRINWFDGQDSVRVKTVKTTFRDFIVRESTRSRIISHLLKDLDSNRYTTTHGKTTLRDSVVLEYAQSRILVYTHKDSDSSECSLKLYEATSHVGSRFRCLRAYPIANSRFRKSLALPVTNALQNSDNDNSRLHGLRVYPIANRRFYIQI